VSLESGGASAWQTDVAADTVTFSQGNLPHGYSQGFGVQALASGPAGGPANWSVQASDNADGSNPITCDGDMSLVIETQPSQINISNVRVTSVGSSNATVLWDTDVASTSQVFYGSDQGYGSQSALTSDLVTSHSVKLTGLASNESYHYQAVSTTPADGGTSTSGDNTLLTAEYVPPIITSQPTLPSNTAANVPGVAIKAVPTEKVPPTVSLGTSFNRPFRQAPLISGRAGDNEAVARVEYSSNGGKDWLPVDHVAPAGAGSHASTADVEFTFTPVIPDDGNYRVVARAIDTSGNIATTPAVTMVIDRLPPQVGEVVISFGPEVLAANSAGLTTLVAGANYRLTTSSIGGATEVTIQAHRPGTNASSSSFALAPSQDSGLWSGTLSLGKGGLFELTASSIDGAGNHTVRSLGSVTVMPAGRTVDSRGKIIDRTKVTLYYLEPASRTWVIWDAAPYGEVNPQTTSHGQYSLMVPAGTYYLEATANGYARTLTQSLNITKPTSLAADITLAQAWQISLGSAHFVLPSITLVQQPLKLGEVNFVPPANSLIGTTLPDFNLQLLTGSSRRAAQLNGRPTVISLVDLWSPASSDQLAALAKLQSNRDIGVVPVFAQESAAYAKNYLATGGYTLDGLADPDGVLVGSLNFGAGPKHIFLDRSGHIKKVMVGVLSEADLKNELGGL